MRWYWGTRSALRSHTHSKRRHTYTLAFGMRKSVSCILSSNPLILSKRIKWFVLFLHNSFFFSSALPSATRTKAHCISLLSNKHIIQYFNHMHINFALCFPQPIMSKPSGAFTSTLSPWWWMILIEFTVAETEKEREYEIQIQRFAIAKRQTRESAGEKKSE